MNVQAVQNGHVQTNIICGKCGSTSIVSENGNTDAMPQRIRALRCLICGNRQEEGAACRWPFFNERNQRERLADNAVEREQSDPRIELFTIKKPRKLKRRAEQTKRESIEWELACS